MKARSVIDSQSFGFLIADIARMSRVLLERRIAAAGLGITAGDARALLYIAAQEGERQTRLAERMGVEPMTACGFIDKLEKQGLVVRQADPRDRRAKQIVTTKAARDLIEAITTETAAMREDILSGTSSEHRDIAMATLRHARTNLQALLSPESAEAEAS